MNKEIVFLNRLNSQIWVETVVYTLIGLVVMGIILAVATPSINRYKDQLVIEQTTTVLSDLNEKIIDVEKAGAANRRIIPELRINRGKLDIDCPQNKIIYTLQESNLEYSQLDQEIKQGDILVKTKKNGNKYDISLTLAYSSLNLTYNGEIIKKTLNPAATSYAIFIENNGTYGGLTQINLGEIS